jgi:hypothetical protein
MRRWEGKWSERGKLLRAWRRRGEDRYRNTKQLRLLPPTYLGTHTQEEVLNAQAFLVRIERLNQHFLLGETKTRRDPPTQTRSDGDNKSFPTLTASDSKGANPIQLQKVETSNASKF